MERMRDGPSRFTRSREGRREGGREEEKRRRGEEQPPRMCAE